MEEKIKLQYANLCGRGNVWRHEIMFTKTATSLRESCGVWKRSQPLAHTKRYL